LIRIKTYIYNFFVKHLLQDGFDARLTLNEHINILKAFYKYEEYYVVCINFKKVNFVQIKHFLRLSSKI